MKDSDNNFSPLWLENLKTFYDSKNMLLVIVGNSEGCI